MRMKGEMLDLEEALQETLKLRGEPAEKVGKWSTLDHSEQALTFIG
jgi:hypothetical protein